MLNSISSMKAKLIKNHYGFEYFLKDENGATIATSDSGKLSIKNCQAIERGYDLDELYNDYYKEWSKYSDMIDFNVFEAGFQKALELMGDKMFSEEDVNGFIDYVIRVKHKQEGMGTGISNSEMIRANLAVFGVFEMTDIRKIYWQEYLKSLQQIEWEVEIVQEEGKDTFGNAELTWYNPKLDANGCLILKRAE